MYELEHDVPIPPRWATRRHAIEQDRGKYQFDRMDVGDSFVVPSHDLADRQALQVAAGRYAARRGWAFTTRTVPAGVRIWRVA